MNRSLSIIILLPALLLIASCGKEAVNEGDGSMNITFVPSEIVSVTESETRAGKYEPVPVPVVSDLPLEEPLFLYTTEEDGITASLGEDESVKSRGAQVGSVSSSFTFGVSEFAVSDGSAVATFQNVSPSYESITGATAVYNSGKRWEAGAYTGNSYAFHAYSPYLSATINGLTLNSGNKTITYDMSSVSAANQPDLMTAYATSSYIATPVGLSFNHQLCAIRIVLGSSWRSGFSVTAVKFKSIYKQGTVTIQNGSWSLTGSKGDYTVSGMNTPTSAGGVVVGESSTYLMMIPQALSGASLEITLKDSAGKSYTLNASISGTWIAGKTVTYTVNPVGITSMTATYPQWTLSGGSTKTYGPVNAYVANSDQFGLYAVKDGSVILSNIPVGVTSVSGQVATLSLPANYFLPKTGTTYFLYYPYKSSPGTVTASGTTADAFFASVISGWSVSTSQNSLANYKAQDLQVAMRVGTSTATFSMAHKMSLGKIVLQTESVPNSRVYNGNTGAITTSGSQNVTPGSTFSSTSPYINPYSAGSNTYYCIAKYNAKPSVADASTTEYAKWSASPVVVQNASSNALGSGNYREFTIRSRGAVRGFRTSYQAIYPYKGSVMSFTPPVTGTYKFECWGASGDANTGNYGKGAYVYGNRSVNTSTTLYVYVGGFGITYTNYGAWNGGGRGTTSTSPHGTGRNGGGGATDIRTVNAAWNDATGLDHRIMVAGGGGGAYRDDIGVGGYGGAPNGGNAVQINSSFTIDCGGKGATQTLYGAAGYHDPEFNYDGNEGPTAGGWGYGGNGGTVYGGGGGGGYWGGGGGGIATGGYSGGGGGSSYISGFSSTGWVRADQSGYVTNPGGGNGYARISFVSQ